MSASYLTKKLMKCLLQCYDRQVDIYKSGDPDFKLSFDNLGFF